MVEQPKSLIEIDLNQFKLYVRTEGKLELSLHFNSPSRRFYLSVIALIVHEMKKLGNVVSIPIGAHYHTLALLNQTIGENAGSSRRESLLPRIYRKWKDALPDLEHAPLFTIPGRKKEYEDAAGKTYPFTDGEKDAWANLFDYKGSHEDVRLRFSVDRLGASLDEVVITYGKGPNLSDENSWDRFIESLEGQVQGLDLQGKNVRVSATTKRVRVRWPALAGVVGLVIVGLIAAVWYFSFHKSKTKADSVLFVESLLPPSDKPSIAVLPFANLTGDPTQEYIADGFSESIITSLSKIPDMLVIARNSTFVYKGKAVRVNQVAKELGVKYVLEGSIQKSGDHMRVSTQLVDAIEGHHLWAESYDRAGKEFFTVQDDISRNIVIALQVELTDGEHARILHTTENLEAWGYVTKGFSIFQHFTKEGNAKARELFKKATELDPNYPFAWMGMACTHYVDFRFGFSDSRAESFKKCTEITKKVTALDDTIPYLHGTWSLIYSSQGQHDKAIAEGKKAVALGPSDATSHIMFAMTLHRAGRFEESIFHAKKAMRLSPFYPPLYLNVLGNSYLMTKQYDKAIAVLRRSLERSRVERVGVIHPLTLLTQSYIEIGEIEVAKNHAAEVLKVDPSFSLAKWKKSRFYKDPAYTKRHLSALRKAGLPE